MKWAIGIDLHGTLLDDRWVVTSNVKSSLCRHLAQARESFSLYICSGNDLTFLKDYVPPEILEQFHGHILETGCVISDGNDENVIVPARHVAKIIRLAGLLKKRRFPFVKYFARRLCTISLFTMTETGGDDPVLLVPEISRAVSELGFERDVMITHSNVAVDIIPVGHNKFTGLKHAAREKSLIGIADSLNDLQLISDSQLSFLPANTSPALIRALGAAGKKVAPLPRRISFPAPPIVYQSPLPSSAAVTEILQVIIDSRKEIGAIDS